MTVDPRKPVAAGVFYPADGEQLASRVRALLEAATPRKTSGRSGSVRAIVVPHGITGVAGSLSATAWSLVSARAFERVLLLGPAHHVPFGGVAAPFADAFATPLGNVMVDRLAIEGIRHLPQVAINDLPHEQEPSLESQLPLLQTCLPGATVVPLVVGELEDAEGAEVVEALWTDRTLVVVSTELSRYFDAATATKSDASTAEAIERKDTSSLGEQQACAHAALRSLLVVAKTRGLSVTRLGLQHTGSGPADVDEVVGYGAFAIG